MSKQAEPRDRCPICNLRLAKVYEKKPGGVAFTAYTTPAGQEVMRCPVHGLYAKNREGGIRKVAVA